jgi:4-hydroxybutyrate CoA-transferase
MKLITPYDILEIIGPKAAIGIGNACAEPQTLINGLIEQQAAAESLQIYSMINFWTNHLQKHRLEKNFNFNVFMVDGYTVEGLKKGFADYIPCRYSKIPELFHKGYIQLDAALISVSTPDNEGNCSYGVSTDFTKAMAENARIVIAEINSCMPWIYGDATINLEYIDYAIETDCQLPQSDTADLTDTDRQIGEYVSQLIDDGATIQIGIGRLSESALESMQDKKHLGVHSGLITDGIVDLMEKGIVDNSRKGLNDGITIGTTMIGTDKLFKFAHKNRAIASYPSDYTHNEVNLAKLNRLHAINSAIQVDLSGQINAETIGSLQISGVGGQTDFTCGAGLSDGGKSIIVIPSTNHEGSRSRIVSYLDRGSAVTSLRHDIDYVVSEYGIARLKGKTLRQRAKEVINIAHPMFRDELESYRKTLYT